MQVSPVNHTIRKAISRSSNITQRYTHYLFTGAHIVHAQPSGEKSHAVDDFGEAQIVKHAKDIGAELNACTDFTESFGLLKHGNGMTILRQYHRGGQAANAATRNKQGKGLWVLWDLCHAQ